MALTITKSKRGPDVVGRRQRVPINIAGDASYPTGGYAVSVGQIGGRGRVIEGFDLISGGNGYTPRWNPATGKVMLFRTGAINLPMEEVPNAVNVTAATFDVAFWVA